MGYKELIQILYLGTKLVWSNLEKEKQNGEKASLATE